MSEYTPGSVYEIYLWDTFEPPGQDTIKLETKDTLSDAVLFAAQRYEFDLCGADRVEIVEQPGSIIRFSFKISGVSRQAASPEAINADLLAMLKVLLADMDHEADTTHFGESWYEVERAEARATIRRAEGEA